MSRWEKTRLLAFCFVHVSSAYSVRTALCGANPGSPSLADGEGVKLSPGYTG